MGYFPRLHFTSLLVAAKIVHQQNKGQNSNSFIPKFAAGGAAHSHARWRQCGGYGPGFGRPAHAASGQSYQRGARVRG